MASPVKYHVTLEDARWLPTESEQTAFRNLYKTHHDQKDFSMSSESDMTYLHFLEVIATSKKANAQWIPTGDVPKVKEVKPSTSLPFSALLLDLRVIGGITLLAGVVLLAASLVFALGIAALIIASLLLTAGVGTGAYAYLNAGKNPSYQIL